MRFSNPQHDQAEHREKVEDIPCHSVECNQCSKFADYNVNNRESAIEYNRIDGRVSNLGVITEYASKGPKKP